MLEMYGCMSKEAERFAHRLGDIAAEGSSGRIPRGEF